MCGGVGVDSRVPMCMCASRMLVAVFYCMHLFAAVV